MIIQDIYNLLVADSVIGTDVYANPCEYLGNCVIYDWTTVESDKIKSTNKLEIHIVADTLVECIQKEDRIKQILLTLGDKPLNGHILQVQLNGGGTLFDDYRNKIHKINYYYVISKGVNS